MNTAQPEERTPEDKLRQAVSELLSMYADASVKTFEVEARLKSLPDIDEETRDAFLAELLDARMAVQDFVGLAVRVRDTYTPIENPFST